jgi:hypothetical protein
LAIPGARLSAASNQPALQTPLHIPAHQLVGRKNRPLVEILGPATEKPIDRGNPQFWDLIPVIAVSDSLGDSQIWLGVIR